MRPVRDTGLLRLDGVGRRYGLRGPWVLRDVTLDVPAGTLLRVEQTGFRPEQKQAFGGALGGWRLHLENLEKTVAALDGARA